MNWIIPGVWKFFNKVIISFFLILAVALIFEVILDHSFGSLIISILPISFISFVCFLVGPFLVEKKRRIAFMNWMFGAAIILVVTFIFSLLGEEQKKTGELIFTYAELILAFPSSLIFPILLNWLEPILHDSFILRLVCAWAICVLAGVFQWRISRWLHEKFVHLKE